MTKERAMPEPAAQEIERARKACNCAQCHAQGPCATRGRIAAAFAEQQREFKDERRELLDRITQALQRYDPNEHALGDIAQGVEKAADVAKEAEGFREALEGIERCYRRHPNEVAYGIAHAALNKAEKSE
jgi:hypothetical protein